MTRYARTLSLFLLLLLFPTIARAADDAKEVAVPDTPVGSALEWFLDAAALPSEEKIASRLGETLNGAPSPEPSTVVTTLRNLRQGTGGGFDVVEIREVDALELDVLLRARNKRSWWMATLGVSASPPHNLSVYELQALVNSPLEGDENWGDLNWKLSNRRLPDGFSISAERMLDGRDKPFLELYKQERVALAPASRLFPLAMLAEQAAENPELLERNIPLRDGLVSLVSPNFESVREGDIYAAKELLRFALMGDLTAVDQLIGWLGRAEVEAFVGEVQGDDSPNFPFLTTGEFFKLKLLAEDDELYRRYVEAETEDQRRAVLVDLDWRSLPSEDDAAAITKPRRVKEIEWRASADEMCDLLDRVAAAMDADETGTVRAAFNEISEENRQLGIWSFVFRVNGGEPGVFAEAYLLERLDGARFKFAILAEDPDEEIDYNRFGNLSDTIIRLMAIDD